MKLEEGVGNIISVCVKTIIGMLLTIDINYCFGAGPSVK